MDGSANNFCEREAFNEGMALKRGMIIGGGFRERTTEGARVAVQPPRRVLRLAREVDEAALDVRRDESDADLVSDVDPGLSPHDATFDRGMQHAHPGSFRRGAGDDRVVDLSLLTLEH